MSRTSFNTLGTSTIQVNGTINEQVIQANITSHGVTVTASDVWDGSLIGSGQVQIFSSEIIDLNNGIQHNVISKRWLSTSIGSLFFDEVGQKDGDVVSVTSTVTGGTGIYKKATGQLTLSGIHTSIPFGTHFTYSGGITLVN
jgi:hypothetical protein